MNFLDIALACAARGWHVFPCWPKTKKPMTSHGYKDASDDPEGIRAWWTKTPNANVAIACGASGIVVLDIDHGIHSEEDLKAFLQRHDLPMTYTVRTGRRPEFGAQLYYSGNFRCIDWSLDGCIGQTRGQGGYVMAAGCIHPDSGERYADLYTVPLAPLPSAVVALKPLKPELSADGVMQRIPEGGGRHAHMTRCAGGLRAQGLDRDSLLASLIPINESAYEVPMPMEDVEHIADSAMKWEPHMEPAEVRIGKPEPEVRDWREHYHTAEEHDNVGPPTFLIEDFLPEQAIMGIGAFVGQKKTLAALNIVFSLCSGEPLFGRYKVTRKPARVLYLGPENGLISFSDRANRIGLRDYLCKSFFYTTMSFADKRPLTALMPEEIQDAAIVIDTAIRFTDGSENDAAMMKAFAEHAFSLIRNKAACVVMLHHSPKSMSQANELTLENSFRGTGELSAFLSVALAMRTQDMFHEYESNSLLRFVKQRDFEPKPSSFEVKTCRDTCRMTFVDGSDGATVKLGNTANKDGKDDIAIAMMEVKANLRLSNVIMSKVLKDSGIERSKEWVRLKRLELGIGGLQAGETANTL